MCHSVVRGEIDAGYLFRRCESSPPTYVQRSSLTQCEADSLFARAGIALFKRKGVSWACMCSDSKQSDQTNTISIVVRMIGGVTWGVGFFSLASYPLTHPTPVRARAGCGMDDTTERRRYDGVGDASCRSRRRVVSESETHRELCTGQSSVG